jgi:hypothetical protein
VEPPISLSWYLHPLCDPRPAIDCEARQHSCSKLIFWKCRIRRALIVSWMMRMLRSYRSWRTVSFTQSDTGFSWALWQRKRHSGQRQQQG